MFTEIGDKLMVIKGKRVGEGWKLALHYNLLGVFVFNAQVACTVNHLLYYLTVTWNFD